MAKSFERVAEDLVESANHHRRRELAYWAGFEDVEQRQQVRDDHKDALRIAAWIAKGKPEKAMKIFYNLDTCARDQVSSDLEKKSKTFAEKYID